VPSARWLIAGFLIGVVLTVSGVFVASMRASHQDETFPIFIYAPAQEQELQRAAPSPRTHPVLGLTLVVGGLALAGASGLGLRRELRNG
jgi:drug/metabolite transporter (DMT)-like permease